ncbi:UNVERIFIED_CONTAM: hypothetical protein H355_014600 [Colinus virginianus]|nr:hypothetical protein H355_014600 [Colinus virginianus]
MIDVCVADVEFVLNLGDWPVVGRETGVEALPLFGWSGGKNYIDIILPQWDVVKTTMFGFDGNKNEDFLSIQVRRSALWIYLQLLPAGGSVPFKHESEYYEWFYADLKPMVHFVPFKADLSDLIEQLQWAEAHPKEAAVIAENGEHICVWRQNVLCRLG